LPNNARKASFPPVVAPDTRVLILGSLPGDKSLEQRRYYANPQNRFWHLVGPLIGVDLVSLPYEERLAALLQGRIGLWDSIASARRDGSLDAAIRDERHHELAKLTASLPELRAVAFNGAKSAAIGMRLLAASTFALVSLPSSSSAHARMPLAEKEKMWAALREFLA
jgi:double-stranded uracil-DNA glycosylase